MPYLESVIEECFEDDNPEGHLQEVKKEAKTFIECGFDPGNQSELEKAYIGISQKQINISYEEFEERIMTLVKYDKKHKGSFARLFEKTENLSEIILSVEGIRKADVSKCSKEVLDNHYEKLREIKKRIDSLDWFEEDFPGNKKLNIRYVYFELNKEGISDISDIRKKQRPYRKRG